MANSEDPDEMKHNAAYHQGLHCLLRQKKILQEKNVIFFLNYNLTPLNIDNGPIRVYYIKPESIGIQKVKHMHRIGLLDVFGKAYFI